MISLQRHEKGDYVSSFIDLPHIWICKATRTVRGCLVRQLGDRHHVWIAEKYPPFIPAILANLRFKKEVLFVVKEERGSATYVGVETQLPNKRIRSIEYLSAPLMRKYLLRQLLLHSTIPIYPESIFVHMPVLVEVETYSEVRAGQVSRPLDIFKAGCSFCGVRKVPRKM